MRKRKMVTVWSKPEEVVKSGYGDIPFEDWCERERDRINKRGDRVKIVKHRDGRIALAR